MLLVDPDPDDPHLDMKGKGTGQAPEGKSKGRMESEFLTHGANHCMKKAKANRRGKQSSQT